MNSSPGQQNRTAMRRQKKPNIGPASFLLAVSDEDVTAVVGNLNAVYLGPLSSLIPPAASHGYQHLQEVVEICRQLVRSPVDDRIAAHTAPPCPWRGCNEASKDAFEIDKPGEPFVSASGS